MPATSHNICPWPWGRGLKKAHVPIVAFCLDPLRYHYFIVCVCVDVIVWSVEGIHVIRDLPRIGYTVCLPCAPVYVSACICRTRLADPRHYSMSWSFVFAAEPVEQMQYKLHQSSCTRWTLFLLAHQVPTLLPLFSWNSAKRKVRHLPLPHSLLSVSAF